MFGGVQKEEGTGRKPFVCRTLVNVRGYQRIGGRGIRILSPRPPLFQISGISSRLCRGLFHSYQKHRGLKLVSHVMKIARRCTVRGRVQGVGFRYFVASEAVYLQLVGWVRNLGDGGVEVLMEGDEPRVLALIDRLREGPRWSRVEDVQVEVLSPSGKFSRFQITG